MTLESMQQQLALLNGGFYLCVFLAIACLIVALVLFWRFDILEVFRERTGITARRAAAEFNKANTNTTGSLAYKSGVLPPSEKLNIDRRISGRLKRRASTQTRATSSPVMNEGSENTALLPSQRTKEQQPEAFTSILAVDFEPEMPNNMAEIASSAELRSAEASRAGIQQVRSSDNDFIILKEIMVIHTEMGLDD